MLVFPWEIVALCPLSIAAATSARAAKPNNSPTAARTLPSTTASGGMKKLVMMSTTDVTKHIRNTFLWNLSPKNPSNLSFFCSILF